MLNNDILLLRCPFLRRSNVPRVLWTRAIGAQIVRFLLDPTITRAMVLPTEMGHSRPVITRFSL